MNRAELLDTAKKCVCGDREQDYGTPEDNFSVIAGLWSEYLGVRLDGVDVAAMMVLLKIGRISSSTQGGTPDTWVDIAGYAACGGEIAFESKGGACYEAK